MPLSEPHAIYLPLPVALEPAWQCHFETGGAVVRLDDEQLPYASRHYITTQRFIRIADDAHELTVACPDAPLWQVGGYTFGRHQEPDGRVARARPLLLAWLTNNYWMTNFQADQGGRIRFRFFLLPSPTRSLGASAQAALAYARPPAAHLYAGRGELRHAAAALLTPDLGPLLLTRLEPDGDGVALTLLNPEDRAVDGRHPAGRAYPRQGATDDALRGAARGSRLRQRHRSPFRWRRAPGRASCSSRESDPAIGEGAQPAAVPATRMEGRPSPPLRGRQWSLASLRA